jgi:hypothetical protein
VAYQEQVSQIDSKISALEARKAAAENLGFTDNADVLQREIDVLQEQRNQTQTQLSAQNSAAGQTAEQKIQNVDSINNPGTGRADTTQDPQTVTAEQKSKLDQAKSGQLSSKVEQSQDPTAASKQDTGVNTPTPPKSESNFSGDRATSKTASVTGNKDVSGKNSDYRIEIEGSRRKNKLHDFNNYTYRITLFLLTKQDYNNLASNPDTFVPTFSLISSGAGFATPGSLKTETVRKSRPWGGYEDVSTTQTKAGRHPDFQTDFFIDNLQMTTVVGLNSKSKATNAIEISFNITEPYGLSLLDRLLSACETCGDRNPNYMSQPYLLQIDILANPTDEILLAQKQTNNVIDTKRIAIKMLEMKIKPTGSGTTYAVRAIPFNHTAFSLTTAAMPVSMKVEAGTVGEFFSNEEDFIKLFAGEIVSQDERVESDLKAWINEYHSTGGFAPTAEQIENQRQLIKSGAIYNSKSLTAGYNTYMENIVKDQQLSKFPPTKIAFNINKEFLNSPIVDDNAQNSDAEMEDTTKPVGQANPKLRTTQTFTINYGTSLIDVIDMVMGKSQYIKNQIKTLGKENNDKQAKENYNGRNTRGDENSPKYIKWYKIVPTVALNDFDASRNDYSKTILYSILPYVAANSYHPKFPQTTAEMAAESTVREYNYLYTGKNEDIIRLDIDFDSTFYTQLTTYRNQLARLGANRLSDPKDPRFPVTQFSFGANSQQTNLPYTIQYVGSNKDANSMNTAANPEEKVVADLKKSIYTSQRGDLLNIKMQIIGDPDFIKQDDIYYNPGSPAKYLEFSKSRTNNIKSPITESGQILFDAQQVYVKVNFNNAVDINDSIGIVNKQDILTNGRRTDGTFTGIYKILTVTSEFARGQFTQTLDLVRMPDALAEISVPAGQNTTSGTASDTQSAKQSEASDNSKQSAIRRNPAGVAEPVSERLAAAAERTPISDPLVNAGEGNPQARPNTYQSAPQSAGNAQNIAPQATSGWTFQDAFRQARKDFGNRPGGVFEYRGKLYQTNYQNEPYVGNPTPVYPGANQ